MKAVVVYESMYGDTRAIADAIGAGLSPVCDVTVVSVRGASQELLGRADLIIVGGPTHAHGMSRATTRRGAIDAARKPGSQLAVDPDAEGPGLRDWLAALSQLNVLGAAFDTRLTGPAFLTGRASKGITSLLRRHGIREIVPPCSFLVTRDNKLSPCEAARARDWGASLAAKAIRLGTAGTSGSLPTA